MREEFLQRDDGSLVRRTLQGGRAAERAIGSLYDRYARLVRAICYETSGNLPDAQDLTQEVFFRAHRKLHSLEHPEKFAPWLVTMARFVCKEWRRRRQRDRHEFVGGDISSTVGAFESELSDDSDRELLDRLRVEIERLPEQERLALHLFYLQDEAVKDARVVLGLSRSGFYRVLERAKTRLATRLQPRMEDKP